MSACFTKALASFFEMMGVIVCILVAALLWLLTSLIFAVANSVFKLHWSTRMTAVWLTGLEKMWCKAPLSEIDEG